MKDKKGFFIATIIFLVILFGMAIMGIYYKLTSNKKEAPVVIEKNTIVFYDGSKSILGKYICQNTYCGFADTLIDDTNYILDYYKAGELVNNKTINDRYAFIYDAESENYEDIILYDFLEKKVLNTYKTIKNYRTLIENNIYFVKDENNFWGIVNFSDAGFMELIAPEYNYIGLVNNFDNENKTLLADRFLILKNNKWGIIDQSNVLLSAYLEEPVISYTGLYIITKVDNYYKIYDYSGNVIKGEDNYIHIAITGKYIELVSENKKLTIYNPENGVVIGSTYLRSIDFSGDTVFPPYVTELIEGNINVKVYTDQQYGTYRTYKYTA